MSWPEAQRGAQWREEIPGGMRGLTLAEVMVGAVIVGILAMVAIPSFIRYQRRMMTTEAFDELQTMYKGAATYYATAYLTANGRLSGCQFPRTQGLTPTESCCTAGNDANGDTRCDANQDAWNTDAWSALSFEMRDKHYFRYGFTNNHKALKDAQATLYAHADLDCNGDAGGYNAATWQRDPDTNVSVISGNTANPGAVKHKKAVVADGITGATELSGFTLYGENNFYYQAGDSGGNSYAVWIRNCSTPLTVQDNMIYAGRGSTGAPGDSGLPGGNGGAGGVSLGNSGTQGSTGDIQGCSYN